MAKHISISVPDRLLAAIRRAWVPLFVLFSLIFLVSHSFSASQGFRYPVHVSLPFLLATIVGTIVYWRVATSIWRRVVWIMMSVRLSRRQSLAHLVMVSLGKYLPGKVWGMVARGAQLARQGVTSEEAAFVTYYEQYILLHASVIVSSLLVSLLIPGAIAIGIIATLFIIVVGVRFRAFGVALSLRILGKCGIRFHSRPVQVASPDYLLLLTQFIFLWLLNSAVLVGIYAAFFEHEVSFNMLAVLFLANVAAVTLGFFAFFVPGGIGVREGIITAILAYSTMSIADAALLSILYRLWTILSELTSGLVVFLTKD